MLGPDVPHSAVRALYPGRPSKAKQVDLDVGFLPRIAARNRTHAKEPTYLVSIGVLSRRGRLMRCGSVRDQTGLTGSVRVGIDFFVSDYLLESLWAQGMYTPDVIASLRADFVIAPNFSVWWADPALEQEYAIARMVRVCDSWTAAGIKAIPALCWADHSHFGRLADFVDAGGYKTVAINLQTLSVKGSVRDQVLSEAGKLLSMTKVKRVLVCGGDTAKSIKQVRKYLHPWRPIFTNSRWQLRSANKEGDTKEFLEASKALVEKEAT